MFLVRVLLCLLLASGSAFAQTSGGFTAGQILTAAELNTILSAKLDYPVVTLNLPVTTSSSVGIISFGNVRYMHTYGVNNLFMGPNAGNFITTSTNNTSIGDSSLNAITTGNGGDGSNTAIGTNTLQFLTSGFYNTAVGGLSLQHVTTGRHNTGVGLNSFGGVTTGFFNVGVGSDIGATITTGAANTIVGFLAGQGIVTGNFNTIIGSGFPTFSDFSNVVILSDGNNGVRFDYGYTNATTITLGAPTTIKSTTFSTLAAVAGTIAYITDALAGNCADGTCTTFGTNVTGGTGALKKLIWYNGTNWKLIGS